MGHEIAYCSLCGARVLETDIASGQAVTVRDKTYCAACAAKLRKPKAAAPDAAETRPSAAGPAASPEPARAPAMQPQPVRRVAPAQKASSAGPSGPALKASDASPSGHGPARSAAHEKVQAPPAVRPPPPAHREPEVPARTDTRITGRYVVRRKNYTPLYIGGGIGLAGLIALAVVMFRGSTPSAAPGPTTASTEDPTTGAQAVVARVQAQKALDEVEQFAATARDPDAVLEKLRGIASMVRGTPVEEQWKKLQDRWRRAKEEAEAARKVDALLERARSLQDTDKDFKQYPEIAAVYQQAREMATEQAPARLAEVNEEERRYSQAYEDLAESWRRDKADLMSTLRSERKHKELTRVIDSFPRHLRHSKVWKSLEKERDELKKAADALASGQEPPKTWRDHLRLGYQEQNQRRYPRAKELILKAAGMIPPKSELKPDEIRLIPWMYYNLACIASIESKSLQGAEKQKAIDESFRYLEKSAGEECFKYHCCNAHNKPVEHWEKDEDLKPIRDDPRFAEILKRYGQR